MFSQISVTNINFAQSGSHVNPIKYTCPRCSIHTCSLPCVKKHKRWAQCSGVRDPAEYRKRAELATPSSIDKDFNFITKVERSVQRADRTNLDKGIDLVPSRTKSQNANSHSKWVQEAEARNLSIIKAPKGLSRNKANKTHWVGHLKCILWTIEWISPEGDIRLSGAHDTKTVDEAYVIAFGKRKHLKRKREAIKQNDQNNAISNVSSTILEKQSLPDTSGLTATPGVAIQNDRGIQQERYGQTQKSEQSTPLSSSLTPAEEKHPVDKSLRCISEDVSSTTGLFFYLHRPGTEARYKCLVPISPQQTMQEILRDRVILEYPTIHIRTEPPSSLPKPFILEQEYLDRYGVDIPINIAVPSIGQTQEENTEGDVTQAEEEISSALSESKVVEVLAKDLGAE